MSHGGVRRGAGRPRGKNKYGEATQPVRLPVSMVESVLAFVQHAGFQLPVYGSKVPAGFPSPADDFIEGTLDLNQHLIKHPAATFIVRASGKSMINAGIHDNDILIVDRSVKPMPGKIVIAAIDGHLTVKRLHKTQDGRFFLMPENPDFSPLEMKEGNEMVIWGVVTNVIHAV